VGVISFSFVLLADIIVIYFGWDGWRWVSKSVLMPVLLLFLWQTARYNNIDHFRVHVLALLLSWAGDILLLGGLFLPGLIAFLWAHLMYIVLFIQLGIKKGGSYLFLRLLFTVLVGLIIGYMLSRGQLEIRWAIMLYGAIIVLMWQLSTLLPRPNRWVITGASSFVLSDFILAYGLFVSDFSGRSLLVMVTYGVAQLSLLIGLRKIGWMQSRLD
jgi:uncharacterized membrane protein YhhN